jgi:hypothetical protein
MNASQLWGNSFLAKRAARGLVKIGIGVPVTVGDMAAISHPCDRGIRTSICSRCRRRALMDAYFERNRRRVTGEAMTIHPTT